MEDLLSVLFLMGTIICFVSAKKFEVKFLNYIGAILLIAFLIIAGKSFCEGFALGMIGLRLR